MTLWKFTYAATGSVQEVTCSVKHGTALSAALTVEDASLCHLPGEHASEIEFTELFPRV